MDTRDLYKLVRGLEDNYNENDIHLHDSFGLELSENFVIETGIVGFTEDGVIIHLDEDALEFLGFNGILVESEDREEEEEPDAYGRTGERYDCMTCGGSGYEYDETCLGCGGLGWCREKKLNEYMKLGGGGDAAEGGNFVMGESDDEYENPVAGLSPRAQRYWFRLRDKIIHQHLNLVRKYGPELLMAAIRDEAQAIDDDDLEEIGTSDWNAFVNNIIRRLSTHDVDKKEGGHFYIHNRAANKKDEIDEIQTMSGQAIEEGAVDSFINRLSRSTNPFEMIYNAISGDYGEEIRKAMTEMYNDVVTDSNYNLHPDDDFEKIIEIMVDQLVDEGGHELDEIKRLALGHNQDELEEGWKSWALGGAALLAAILGGNEMAYQHALKTDPQLSKLVSYLELAQKRHDADKVKELKDRIKQTYDHLAVTGGEVMGDDGRPVDPVYEAEYHGRKVPLGKPMQGDVAKSKVYVRKPNGKVVKVNFGDPNMRIKKNSPSHRKSFRARHHCENPGPRWKARYWSCKMW